MEDHLRYAEGFPHRILHQNMTHFRQTVNHVHHSRQLSLLQAVHLRGLCGSGELKSPGTLPGTLPRSHQEMMTRMDFLLLRNQW